MKSLSFVTHRSLALVGVVTLLVVAGNTGRVLAVSIALDSVIGPAGTNAASVKGVGNVVNNTDVPSDPGATTLTITGSTSPVSFDFNTGFTDAQDRTDGGTAFSTNIFADRKFDSASATPLIFDRNNNINFGDETDDAPSDSSTFHLGFGMHANGLITFDLDAIRTANGLASGTAFTLTGGAGVADRLETNSGFKDKSGAILLDGVQLAVFDWNAYTSAGVDYHVYDTYNLAIAGTARYLTFAGLSGIGSGIGGDHVGFDNPTLTTIPTPEPRSFSLLGCGIIGFVAMIRRQHAKI